MSGPGAGGGIILTFSTPGLDSFTQKLQSMFHVVDDLTPVWQQIAQDLAADAALNYIGQGDIFSYAFARAGGATHGEATGSAWAPLAPSTVREKARKGYPADLILVRTGMLEESLISVGAAGNITDVQPLGMRFGTMVPYAGFHQFGTRKMPQRPILGMTQQRQAKIIQAVGDYIRQKIRQL